MGGDDRGYQEIEHTADWMLEVWAPDLPGLLEQAAIGMAALSGIRLEDGERRDVTLELPLVDPETLLVRFLAELLYLGELQGLGFDRYDLSLADGKLTARLRAAPILERDKEIKAVTYHNLKVQETRRGLEAQVVFDV